jgi:hypothetical protein
MNAWREVERAKMRPLNSHGKGQVDKIGGYTSNSPCHVRAIYALPHHPTNGYDSSIIFSHWRFGLLTSRYHSETIRPVQGDNAIQRVLLSFTFMHRRTNKWRPPQSTHQPLQRHRIHTCIWYSIPTIVHKNPYVQLCKQNEENLGQIPDVQLG